MTSGAVCQQTAGQPGCLECGTHPAVEDRETVELVDLPARGPAVRGSEPPVACREHRLPVPSRRTRSRD
jgi:hypothetical protein